MKKPLLLIGMFICSIVVGKYKSLDEKDTTIYQKIISLKELKDFGYKYYDKNVMLHVYFQEITTTNLNFINEIDKITIDANKTNLFIGFNICDENENSNNKIFCLEPLINIYGYKIDILEKLKKLNKNDGIVIFGKVVKYSNGENYGVKIKYMYTSEEYNTISKKNKGSIFTKFFWILLSLIFFSLYKLFKYIKNQNIPDFNEPE